MKEGQPFLLSLKIMEKIDVSIQRPSGAFGEYQLFVTMNLTNRSHLTGEFQCTG